MDYPKIDNAPRCSSTTSLRRTRCHSRVLGPDVLEDESGDDKSTEDSNHSIANRELNKPKGEAEAVQRELI